MGKVQSKEGDCFVVNAHFNPVCHQLDEISRTSNSSHDQSKTTSRSTVGLSKMSLSISRDNIIMNQKVGNEEEKYPLKVILPQDSPSAKMTKNFHLGLHKEDKDEEEEDHEGRPEKAEEEKSEKEEKQSRLKKGGKISCDVSVDDLEKQEFSFTLYDFNGHGKVTKDDVAGLVRSIYEALGRSVKLPPSGSRTIKVHLAVSPDSPTTNLDLPDCTEGQDMLSVNKGQAGTKECLYATNVNCQNIAGSEPSIHTLSTYISSTVEKIVNSESPSTCPHGCVTQSFNHHTQPPTIQPPNPPIQDSPIKKHPMENLLTKDVLKDGCRDRFLFKRIPETHNVEPKDPSVQHRHRHHHRHQYGATATNRDHVTECRERRNHYLDLVGTENCGPKMDNYASPYAIPVAHQPSVSMPQHGNPIYSCPCRVIERPSHNLCHGGANFTSTQHDCVPEHTKRFHMPCVQERSQDHVSHFLKYQVCKNRQDDLLNVNFDLCDLTPNEKFDWEYIHQHRRSKSYDIYDKKLENHLSSPRTKQKLFKPGHFSGNPLINTTMKPEPIHVPSSPNHHYRHRHREREHQRAMQQVANWIEKEHLGAIDSEEPYLSRSKKSPLVMERHEHHHLHEHIHHHYHHY